MDRQLLREAKGRADRLVKKGRAKQRWMFRRQNLTVDIELENC